MSKQILTNELAELVTTLLVNPELVGQLDLADQHHQFIEDIAEVVTKHCGGQLNQVNPADFPGDADPEHRYAAISISPDESLPSLHQNIWQYHDTEGWEGEEEECAELGLELGTKPSDTEIRDTRKKMQSLLANVGLELNTEQTLEFPMLDWEIADGDTTYAEEGDEQVYQAKVHVSNQPVIEILDQNNEIQFSVMCEINKGVPALHLSPDAGDNLLHINRAQGGLIIVPEDTQSGFMTPTPNRHTYNDRNALLIQG